MLSMLDEIRRIANRNKKDIQVWKVLQYNNIARVYLQVFDVKILEPCTETKNWDTSLNVGVTLDVKEELKMIAEDNDCSVQQVMRDIVDDFIMNTPR